MMKTATAMRDGVVLIGALLALLSMWSTVSAQPADSHMKGTMIVSPIKAPDTTSGDLTEMAAGATDDTLKACRARIPELASVGQHMLAEQSCVGEANVRQALRSAPKF